MSDKIFHTIRSLADQFQGFLLDAYGVFWGGNSMGALPGTVETMEYLISKGKIIGILSNSTQLSSKEIEKFQKHGIHQNRHFHFMVTSGDLAKSLLLKKKLPFKTPRNTFYLFGEPHPKFSSHQIIFQDTTYKETPHIEEADFIYIAIPHIKGEDQTDPELFRKEIEQLVNTNLPMVCNNPDRFAHEGKPPRAVVRQGTIAALYEDCGGTVFYIGKPSSHGYAEAMEQFRQRDIDQVKSVLMVGDTPETDIRGASLFGMPSALVIHTGIMADRLSHHGFDKAISSLSKEDLPDYFLEEF